MERLTKRENGIAYFPKCFEEPCCGSGCTIDECDFLDAVCEKLEKYEDIEKKGCGHCKVHDDFQADMIVFQNGNEKVEVQLCFGRLEIIHKRDEEVIYHVDTEINYCPMCGRKLVEE